MARLSGVFDRTGAVRRPSYWRLLREVSSVFTYRPPLPDSIGLPDGLGHIVLVVPAFLTTDVATRKLRLFLNRCGYRSVGWGLGVNWGPTPRLLVQLRRRLAELRNLEGGRVSLVGLSLGGLLVRDMAYDCPDEIR